MNRSAQRVKQVGRLAPVAVAMLESLYQHRLLSTAHLHALHTPDASLRWTQMLLARLHGAGLASVTRRPGGLGLWYLTAVGVDAVETIVNRSEQRRKLVQPAQAAGPLQAHTLAVNEAALAFVRVARERKDEFGPFAWRHEIAHPLGPSAGHRRGEQLIADAVLTYQLNAPDGSEQFPTRFLELDRATMPVDGLAAKLSRYARLYRYGHGAAPAPLWRSRYPVFPDVMVVLDGAPRSALQRRRATLLALCLDEPDLARTPEVAIKVCLLEDLIEEGPFSAIFRAPTDPRPSDWLGSCPESTG